MAAKTDISTIPTDYQTQLLLAALADEEHRIPSDARGATLDIMYSRQWIKEYTADGRLASAVRNYPGFTHFRLTHHGVNAANKAKAQVPTAQTAVPAEEYPANPAGLAAADRDLYAARFLLRTEQRKNAQLDLHDRCVQLRYRIAEILAELSRAAENLPVKPTFRYWKVPETIDDAKRCCIECGESVDGLVTVEHTVYGVGAVVCLAHDGQQVRALLSAQARRWELEALAERYPVDSVAVHTPEGDEAYADTVTVKSGPGADGTVDVVSSRYTGKLIQVPLDSLQPLSRFAQVPLNPDYEVTGWWTVTDRGGRQITLVRADSFDSARAELNPQTRQVGQRLGGLLFRPIGVPELPAALAAAVTSPAERHAEPRRAV